MRSAGNCFDNARITPTLVSNFSDQDARPKYVLGADKNSLYPLALKYPVLPFENIRQRTPFFCHRRRVRPFPPLRLQEDGPHLRLQFQFRFTRDSEEVFFAFCFPHSYEDCKRDLERCEDQACAVHTCSLRVLRLPAVAG